MSEVKRTKPEQEQENIRLLTQARIGLKETKTEIARLEKELANKKQQKAFWLQCIHDKTNRVCLGHE